MGPEPMLCVEQKVVLTTDSDKAREVARAQAEIYSSLPNYRNNWMRLGISEEDINNLSDSFIDATFAWGDEDSIQARVQAHFDAGASHVCIQPINPNGVMGDPDWKVLEALAPANS